MDVEKKMLNLWMPINKTASGNFVGILSDTSIDRDGEFMTKELLDAWAKKSTPLPLLANHENKLEKLIGGWTEKKVISKGDTSALVATPFFLESNPLGKQAKAMVEEALEKGLGIGISIGAIPKGEMVEKEIDGKTYKGYTQAEILEATIVPLQSNRNASFLAMAKSFGVESVTKREEGSFEQCVLARKEEGMSKEDAVKACRKEYPEKEFSDYQVKYNVELEVSKMSEEQQESAPVEAAPEAEAQPEVEAAPEAEAQPEVEAPVEEAPVEESAEEPAVESAEEKSIELELQKLRKEVETLRKTSVNTSKFEKPVEKKVEMVPSINNMLKARFGLQ